MDEEVRQKYLSCLCVQGLSTTFRDGGNDLSSMHAYGVVRRHFMGGERIVASCMGSAAASLMVSVLLSMDDLLDVNLGHNAKLG